VVEANPIPRWICADWKLYKEILSHILLSAIKTSGNFGKVTIAVSYHSFVEKLP